MLGPILQWVNKIYQRVDANVSSRSSHSAQDVWSVDTRTLTATASPIRSIQRGFTTSSQGNNYVTISSVNTSKAFVSMSTTAYAGSSAAEGLYTVRIMDSTEINVRNYGSDSSDLGDSIAWEVIEFE